MTAAPESPMPNPGSSPTWKVFRGDGMQRTAVQLPSPPPWRVFGNERAQPAGSSLDYSRYPDLINAINVSITLRRPLLLTGPAGMGKSSVAEAITYELGLGNLLRWNVTSRATLEDALYRYDALARLREHQIDKSSDRLENYLRLGPLGTALASADQRVLLIDELDKGDIDLPGDLLNVLERGEYEIPELARHKVEKFDIREHESEQVVRISNGKVECRRFPIVVITSNGEREFPPALLRRCIRERVPIPDGDQLAAIVTAHLGPELTAQANDLIEAFAHRLSDDGRPEALAIDQLLNTVLMLTGTDAPHDPDLRGQLTNILQRELRTT